jgi:hypothetical protein
VDLYLHSPIRLHGMVLSYVPGQLYLLAVRLSDLSISSHMMDIPYNYYAGGGSHSDRLCPPIPPPHTITLLYKRRGAGSDSVAELCSVRTMVIVSAAALQCAAVLVALLVSDGYVALGWVRNLV